jgi:hypothetical protein
MGWDYGNGIWVADVWCGPRPSSTVSFVAVDLHDGHESCACNAMESMVQRKRGEGIG